MDEYTPSDKTIRIWYVKANPPFGDVEFDRWIEAHDRQVAAKALTDAADDAQQAFVDEQNGIGFARVRTDWLRARAFSLVPGNPEPTEGENRG